MCAPIDSTTLRVLAVIGSARDARRIQEALSEARGAMAVRGGTFDVVVASDLPGALAVLADGPTDVVLLDLGLAGSEGLCALASVTAAAPDAAVVVVASADDEGTALRAVRLGAQECLGREQVQGCFLARTIRLAFERKQAEAQQREHARKLEAAHAQVQQQAAELKARADELCRVNRELDDFAFVVSHDLKEPLRAIHTYCEILQEDYHDRLDADGQRRLAAMGTSCDRLADKIDNLLGYCRVGRVLDLQPNVDLDAVMAEVLRTLEAAICSRRAAVHVAGRLPRVAGDATLIGMALANLVSNGLKFNRQAEPRVEVGVMSGRTPVIYVRDDGIGIDRQHHETIFEIFRRLHGRTQYEGHGVGLAIVRKIVEAHGGRLWLDSEPGRGSTFYFTLAPAGERLPAAPPHWISCSPVAAGKTDE
jgi:signal transduction histidine kinase